MKLNTSPHAQCTYTSLVTCTKSSKLKEMACIKTIMGAIHKHAIKATQRNYHTYTHICIHTCIHIYVVHNNQVCRSSICKQSRLQEQTHEHTLTNQLENMNQIQLLVHKQNASNWTRIRRDQTAMHQINKAASTQNVHTTAVKETTRPHTNESIKADHNNNAVQTQINM